MKSKKTLSILLVLILMVGAVAGVMGYKRSQSGVIAYVKNHTEEMTAYAQDLLETGTAGEAQAFHDWPVTVDPNRGQVEFFTSGSGMGSETSYKGVYYSAADTPLGVQGAELDFTAAENGWRWEEADGDNWQYTERIVAHWFWYEAHY